MSKAEYWQRGESIDYKNTGSSAIEANSVIVLGKRVGVAGMTIQPGETGSLRGRNSGLSVHRRKEGRNREDETGIHIRDMGRDMEQRTTGEGESLADILRVLRRASRWQNDS